MSKLVICLLDLNGSVKCDPMVALDERSESLISTANLVTIKQFVSLDNLPKT